MKRLCCIVVLCLFLVTICMPLSVGALGIEGAASFPMAAGDSIAANSISIWGNYIFAATNEEGLEIIDMEDNSVIAKWNLKSTEIIPGLGTFSALQTVVTDEYIICADSANVVVFPNEGKYSNTPPQLVARITPNPSKAKRTFNELKRMFVCDGFLYLFDLTAANQVNAVDNKEKQAVVWKVDLSELENAEFEFENQKWISLEGVDCADFAVIGEHEYFWDTIKIDNNYAYCVTYNNEAMLPKKTLTLNKVDLDTLECSAGDVMQFSASGLQTVFTVNRSITLDEIRELEMYVSRVDETVYIPLRLFLDVENTEYLMIDIVEADGKSTVKIMFSENVISALVDIFDCRENDIVNNGIAFAVDVDGVQYEFEYKINDVNYNTGVIALDEEKDNAYIMTGAANGENMIIAVSHKDLDNIKSIGKKIVTPLGTYNIAVDAICGENELIALYKGGTSRAAVYDISSPGKIPYNFARTLELDSGIYLSSTLSQMVHYGNKYYYADTMGRSVGVLETDESVTYAKMFQKEGEMPVRVYGYSTEEDTVKIILDEESEVEVPVYNGVWSYTVGMAENGEHIIDVEIGRYSEHFEYTVDMELPATIDNVEFNDNDELSVTITNNTNRYGKSLQVENIKAIAVLCENNMPYLASEVDVEVSYGESGEAVFSDIWGMDVEMLENGTIKLFLLSEGLAPITTEYTYTYENMELSEAHIPTVIGNIASISFDEPEVDANNKTISASGNVSCDGARPVVAVITFDGYIYDVQQTICDENGDFSFEYYYGNDPISGDAEYMITVNAMMGKEEDSIEEIVSIMDQDVFDEKVAYIVENIETGEALLGYLGENSDFSKELGLNLENEVFDELSHSDKIEVMNTALEIIKSGERSALADTFKTESENLKRQAEAEKIKEEINDATKSSLKGILEKYKDFIGISDEVWEDYTDFSNKKILSINKKFLKTTVNDIEDVEEQLQDAIDYVENNDGGNGGSDQIGGGSGIGGSYQMPSQKVEVVPVNPETVYNPDEVAFADLESAQWAKDAILSLAEKKIVNGVSRTQFNPNDNVTREQFVKMLVIAFGLENKTAVSNLKDVNKNEWYYEYVAAAEECGLVKGDGENFGVGRVLSREEMATFAYRAALIAGRTLPNENESQSFIDDAQISDYAKESILNMQKAGIINGIGDGLFAPYMSCSRAMSAKVVYELLNI